MRDEVYTMGLLNRFTAILVAPGLLAGWYLTGNIAYFNFFRVLVGLSTLGFTALLVNIGLMSAQNKKWRNPVVSRLLHRYMWLTALSWIVSLGCAAFCFRIGKPVIGWFVLINLSMYMLFRYLFVVGDHKGMVYGSD